MSEPQDKPPVETGAEPLARPRRTLWQRLGGEGLALSVLVHIAVSYTHLTLPTKRIV